MHQYIMGSQGMKDVAGQLHNLPQIHVYCKRIDDLLTQSGLYPGVCFRDLMACFGPGTSPMDILRPAPKQPGQMALNAANRLRASIAKAMNQDDVWTLFDIAQGQDHHLLLVQHVHQMLRDLLTALGHDRPDGSVKTPPPGSAAHCAIEYALPAKQQHLLWLCAMIYMALTYLEEYTSDLDNYCWRYFGPVLTAVTTAASLDSDALDRIATRSLLGARRSQQAHRPSPAQCIHIW